jgi:hypothetical protein
MYERHTILKLKEPRSTEDEVFPYDVVEVVGQSPINHGQDPDWGSGQSVIIRPYGDVFAATLDEPYNKLRELYEIVHVPDPEEVEAPIVKHLTQRQLGPSPEDVFREQPTKKRTRSKAKDES